MDDEMDSLEEELNKRKEIERKRFGVESTLQQLLWDGQVEDGYFNDTMTGIVLVAKKCCEDEEWKKQLYEIDLDEFKDDEEEI